MESMESIATLTMNPALDIASQVDRLVPNQKLRSRSRRYYPGGGGINVARVIHRFGGNADAVFPAGGAIGEKLTSLLAAEGISYRAVPVKAEVRENIAVHVKDPGELYHFVMPGPQLSEEDAQHCLDALARIQPAPRYLVASGSLPPGVDDEFYARVAHLAHRHDTRLILDTSGPPLAAALEEGVYLIKPNRREFADLAGEALAEDGSTRRDQVREMVARESMKTLIVTLGADGAILATKEEQIVVRPPSVEGVSPVGAGDSFVALLTLKLAQGLSQQEALCFAVAAAAAAILTGGGELCHKEDVDRLYEEMQGDGKVKKVHKSQ